MKACQVIIKVIIERFIISREYSVTYSEVTYFQLYFIFTFASFEAMYFYQFSNKKFHYCLYVIQVIQLNTLIFFLLQVTLSDSSEPLKVALDEGTWPRAMLTPTFSLQWEMGKQTHLDGETLHPWQSCQLCYV